jgi:putative ABC transport system permease protein
MDALMARSVVRPRFNATLVGSFAVIALLLAVVGLYGVISYAVSTRSHEIGIRIALGADGKELIKAFLREAAFLIAIGLVLGAVGALALSGLISGLLFGVDATDMPTYLGTALLLAAVALAACVVPALRASRIDPVQAMRIE